MEREMNQLTILLLVFIGLAAAYVISWRWINKRFGYAMDGKYHIVLFMLGAPFVIAAIGFIYLVMLVKDKTSIQTRGSNNEIDI